MPRRKSMLMLGLVLLVLTGILGGVVLLLRHEPDFYRKTAVVSDENTQSCIGTGLRLKAFFQDPGDQQGENFVFREADLNSFFVQGFGPGSLEAEGLEKHGISKLRVSFDKDRIRLAFRHKTLFMSTVVSLEMRVWLVPAEQNVFAVEIISRRAGALPISTQALLEEISTIARKRKMEVNWYRHEGHPVALLRIQSNGPHPPAKFHHVNLESGKMTIGVVSNDQASGDARGRPAPGPVILNGN